MNLLLTPWNTCAIVVLCWLVPVTIASSCSGGTYHEYDIDNLNFKTRSCTELGDETSCEDQYPCYWFDTSGSVSESKTVGSWVVFVVILLGLAAGAILLYHKLKRRGEKSNDDARGELPPKASLQEQSPNHITARVAGTDTKVEQDEEIMELEADSHTAPNK